MTSARLTVYRGRTAAPSYSEKQASLWAKPISERLYRSTIAADHVRTLPRPSNSICQQRTNKMPIWCKISAYREYVS